MTKVLAPRPPLAVAILRLAGPVALARLGIMGMGVADTIMVGQIAPDELSHQALGWAPTGTALVAGIGLLFGVQVLAARVIGEGRPEDAGAVWRLGALVGLVAGAALAAVLWIGGAGLLTAFGVSPDLAEPAAAVMRILALSLPLHLFYTACASFLEATQRPNFGMALMWAANILNVGLNYWLVHEAGAQGSAWATLFSRVFLAAGMLAFIVWWPAMRQYRPLDFARKGPGVGALMAIGVAAAVSQAVEAGAFSAMTIIAGRIGAQEVAAYAILLNTIAVTFMIALGLAAATAVLASDAIGRGARAEAGRVAWMGLGLNTAFMVAAGLVYVTLSAPIASAFTQDAVLAALVVASLPVAALALAPDGGQTVAASALRALGDNWFPTWSHVLSYAIVMPPLAYWLADVQGWGVPGLIAAITLASALSVAVLMVRLWIVAKSGYAPKIQPSS